MVHEGEGVVGQVAFQEVGMECHNRVGCQQHWLSW